MKAVIYARVSTEDQSTDNQVPVLMKWAADLGYEVIEVFQESASAWKDGHQKELAELMKCAHRRRFQVVLVWALDRLTRQGPYEILSIYNKLLKLYGVKVISYQESWTMFPGEFTELLLSITGWIAGFESKRRSERTRAGIARKRREGFTWGRPKGSRDSPKCKRQHRARKLPHEEIESRAIVEAK